MPKDNEAASWREKLDQLYKSSSQNFRVVVHGSKVCTSFFMLLYFTKSFSISYDFLGCDVSIINVCKCVRNSKSKWDTSQY